MKRSEAEVEHAVKHRQLLPTSEICFFSLYTTPQFVVNACRVILIRNTLVRTSGEKLGAVRGKLGQLGKVRDS